MESEKHGVASRRKRKGGGSTHRRGCRLLISFSYDFKMSIKTIPVSPLSYHVATRHEVSFGLFGNWDGLQIETAPSLNATYIHTAVCTGISVWCGSSGGQGPHGGIRVWGRGSTRTRTRTRGSVD